MRALHRLLLVALSSSSSTDDVVSALVLKKIFKRSPSLPKTNPEPGVAYVDGELGNIFKQNLEWADAMRGRDPDFFTKLGATHKPPFMWIGCADARVPANEVMGGEDAGEVFTLRNVANLVVNTDVNVLSALQYAVDVLKVQHIIVCGHYECGGVKASMANVDHAEPLENWLRNLRDTYRIHRDELDSIEDDDERHRRLVDINVVEQCINVWKTGAVQKRRAETHAEREAGKRPYTTPRIHGMVFDPKTGNLKKLDINFDEYIDELGSVYELYSMND